MHHRTPNEALAVRICLVYDCLYPYTVGGAERWYRNLGERLAEDGHEVVFLTLRQWPRDAPPTVPGVEVRAVGPRMALYSGGRRRILPPLLFGIGVLFHLVAGGRSYDAVHSAATPYFSPLAAGLAAALHRYALVIDWHEVWTREYWREYLGRAGDLGWAVQRLCARMPHHAFCFSVLHANRLRSEGFRGQPVVLKGEYAGDVDQPRCEASDGVAVYVGRHIPEKRVPALVRGIQKAREVVPQLTCDVYGDGPDRSEVERLIKELELGAAVRVHGFVDEETIDHALRHAMCMVLPSRREGYGLVVVEAAARGTPSVVVDGTDNAATELVDDGENGVIARSASPEDLAEALLRVHDAGKGLRDSTAAWFERNARRLSLAGSLDAVAAAYRRGPTRHLPRTPYRN